MATCMYCGAENPALPEEWTSWQCSLCEVDGRRTCAQFYENQKSAEIPFHRQLEDGLEILDPEGDLDNEYDGLRNDSD